MITVSEVMSTQVSTLRASDSIATAKEIMKTENIRHIPIVDGQSFPVGLVTQRDILKLEISEFTNNESENKISVIDDQVRVDEIMTREIAYVHPREPLRIAGLKIQKHKYGCLPVIENNQLVGIITDSDFVSVAIDLIEQIEYNEDM